MFDITEALAKSRQYKAAIPAYSIAILVKRVNYCTFWNQTDKNSVLFDQNFTNITAF